MNYQHRSPKDTHRRISRSIAGVVELPAPDAVIFLDLDQDQAEKRGG
jgi:hypothetical protein